METTTTNKPTTTGEVTPTQISQWKQEYAEIMAYEVEMDEEGKDIAIGYFKKPDLNIIMASSQFADEEPIKANIMVFEHCWLGGDERIKVSEEAKLSVAQLVSKSFKLKVARLKKL